MKNIQAYLYRHGGLDCNMRTYWIPQHDGMMVVDVSGYRDQSRIANIYITKNFGGNLKDGLLKKVKVSQVVIDQLRGLMQFNQLVSASLT